MLKNLALAGAIVLSASFSPQAVGHVHASPEFFESISGKWRGKGLVKSSEKGKKESIRCRMSNTVKRDGRIDLSGNCAVSGFVFSLNGYIEQNSGNSYTASMFRSLANLKQSNFSGKRSGNRLNLSFKARDRVTKQDVTATIVLNSKSSNAFDVQISRSDPDTGNVFNVGTIAFGKRS